MQQSPRLTPADSLSESDFAAQDSSTSQFSKVYYEEPGSEQDILNLARALFDLKEYRKCAHMLTPIVANGLRGGEQNSTRSAALVQNCLFLKNHALFLVSEQSKEEEILETGGSTDKIICSPVINSKLSSIESELEEYMASGQRGLDAFNSYLLGLIYKEKNKKMEARDAFIRALNQMPLLWSAWLELGSLISQTDRQVFDQLRDHWMLNFYFASFYLDI